MKVIVCFINGETEYYYNVKGIKFDNNLLVMDNTLNSNCIMIPLRNALKIETNKNID